MKTLEYYAYLRVSSKGQIEGDGFDRQLETITKFGNQQGLKLAGIYQEEGVSGTLDVEDRPAFKEMITAILTNGVNTVIVESLDRLAREYRVSETLLIYLVSKDIRLLSANTGEDVTEAIQEDPMRKALIQIQGIFAELDKSLLVAKLKKARERIRQKTGRCGGRLPYGSTPEEARILHNIKLWRRKPSGNGKALTYQEIADRLNLAGILTKDGKQWNKGSIHLLVNRPKKRLATAINNVLGDKEEGEK